MELNTGRDPVTPWLALQVRQLAALAAVVEEQSFSRAAERLGYTQSAISQQIAALEKVVGERLLVRPERASPLALTPAGRIVLRYANDAIGRVRSMSAELGALKKGKAGLLRLGVYQSVGASLLPMLLGRYAKKAVGVDLQVQDAVADFELFRALEAGDLDLAFAVFPLPDGPFEGEELYVDPYQLVVRKDSPLASRARVPVAELHHLPVVCFRRCRGTDHALDVLQQRGVSPDVVFRSDDNGTVLGLVAAGLGAGLLPSLCVSTYDLRSNLVARQLEPPELVRRGGLAWHRTSPPAGPAAEFVDLCRASLPPGQERRLAAIAPAL
jgi:DNA-binding transcriptional LysR family regulator